MRESGLWFGFWGVDPNRALGRFVFYFYVYATWALVRPSPRERRESESGNLLNERGGM